MPVKIFFCYAHEDEALLVRLKAHLKPLERQDLIEIWYDREISAGTEWEREISQRLNEAQIILLLISPDFMNSEYCYGTELKRALERHKRGEACVIPVIGRAVYWQGILGQLQALPKDALPITDPDWHDQDRALYNVAEGLRKIVDQILHTQEKPKTEAQQPVFPVQNPTSLPPPHTATSLSISLSSQSVTPIVPAPPSPIERAAYLPPKPNRRAFLIGVGAVGLATISGGALLAYELLNHQSIGSFPTSGITPTASPNPTQAAIAQAKNDYKRNFTINGVMYGFDAQHTRTNPYEIILNTHNVSGLKLYWTAPTKGKVSSSPAVTPDGVVYVGSEDSSLYAFDTTNKGATLWKGTTGGSIKSSPAVAPNGVVYVGSDDGNLYAFDPSTGNKPLWVANTGALISSSPTVVNGIVYVGSQDKTLYAFNAFTGGKPLWTFPTGSSLFGSPAVVNGIVYIGSRDNNLYAFNALTGGKPLWTFPTGAGIDASPAIAGPSPNGAVYVGSRDGYLYAVNASTGIGLWKASTNYTFLNSSAAVTNEVVYVGSRDGNLYAFDTISNRGSELWHALTSSGNNGIETSPTVANGVVYVASDDGNLYAFNANTGGAPLWTSSVGAFYSCPAVANGVIYIGSEFNNALYAFHLP